MMTAAAKEGDHYALADTAMQYHQFHPVLVVFIGQAPACPPAEVTEQRTGHSGKRTHPTMAGLRRCPEAETQALGNWQGGGTSVQTSMPLRYNGVRDLTQLGLEMESVLACGHVLSQAEAGEQLTWPRVEKLHSIPGVGKNVADLIAKTAVAPTR